jgi:hypothetical protein
MPNATELKNTSSALAGEWCVAVSHHAEPLGDIVHLSAWRTVNGDDRSLGLTVPLVVAQALLKTLAEVVGGQQAREEKPDCMYCGDGGSHWAQDCPAE